MDGEHYLHNLRKGGNGGNRKRRRRFGVAVRDMVRSCQPHHSQGATLGESRHRRGLAILLWRCAIAFPARYQRGSPTVGHRSDFFRPSQNILIAERWLHHGSSCSGWRVAGMLHGTGVGRTRRKCRAVRASQFLVKPNRGRKRGQDSPGLYVCGRSNTPNRPNDGRRRTGLRPVFRAPPRDSNR